MQDSATVTISGPVSGTGTDSDGDVLDDDDAASDISPLSRTSSERSSGRLIRVKDKELSGNMGEYNWPAMSSHISDNKVGFYGVKRYPCWYGHVSRSSGLAKTILQGTVKRGKKMRQTEEEMGRQHQGMDRPGVRQVPEGSGEQRKMKETGCEVICGALVGLHS